MADYKIRRNEEGNILFFDVKEVIDLCLENNLLTGEKNNWIAIYRLAGSINPEGWYKEDYHDVIQELMRDEEGFLFLLKELENKGIDFIPSLSNELLRTFDNGFKIEETNMSDFVIENNVLKKYIGKDRIVRIPDGITSINFDAFDYCESMEFVVIPTSIKEIDEVCGISDSTIICAKDSYAAEYAARFDNHCIEIPEDEFIAVLTQEEIEEYIEEYQKEKEGLIL